MNFNSEPIKNWFGYTRRERRSGFIILLIILLILGLRYTLPESRIHIEDITGTVSATANPSDLTEKSNISGGEAFSFDPNTASYDTLMKIGFTPKEANTLINYRNKGARFMHPSDIKKVYGVKAAKAEKLIPLVKVNQRTSQKGRSRSLQQKPGIDINTSDSATLVRLPGIGPVLSVRIIKYRRLLGGYARIDQLKEVYGLTEETFEIIKGRVFADSGVVSRININSAGYKELTRFPYFEKSEVIAILKYRELKGRINDITYLTENKLITTDKAKKIHAYLNFD